MLFFCPSCCSPWLKPGYRRLQALYALTLLHRVREAMFAAHSICHVRQELFSFLRQLSKVREAETLSEKYRLQLIIFPRCARFPRGLSGSSCNCW
jgi:hypothetical protein